MNKIYWACRDIHNFGDVLSAHIYKKITGKDAVWTGTNEPHFMICGSIVRETTKHSVVAGAGLGDPGQAAHKDARYVFVRGPLTAGALRKQGINAPYLFDPAVVLPLYYTAIPKQHRLGIIPHYVDYVEVEARTPKDINVIDLTGPCAKVIREIQQCNHILSSSLHGVIVAQAFGIPARWVLFSDKVVSTFKFYDYFLSMGLPKQTPLALKGKPISQDLVRNIPIVPPNVVAGTMERASFVNEVLGDLFNA